MRYTLKSKNNPRNIFVLILIIRMMRSLSKTLFTNAFKAMSNPHRLLIRCMLCDAPGTSAGELARITGLSPSATSQHLARMREEQLIEYQRLHYAIKYAYFSPHPRQHETPHKSLKLG